MIMKHEFWSGKKKFFFLLLYFSDMIAFLLSALIAVWYVGIDITDPYYIRFYIFSLLIIIIIYSNYGLYNDKRNLFDDSDLMNILYSSMITFLVLLFFIIMFNPQDIELMGALIINVLLSIAFTVIGRVLLNKIVYLARMNGLDIRKTILFGDENDELLEKLKDKHLGYDVIAVTKSKETLKKHLQDADIVFIKMESINDEMLELIMKHEHINWKIISSVLNLVIEPVAFDEFKDYPIINITNKDTIKNYSILKRLMDIILSGMTLVALSPVFLIVAIIIKITMPGPVFYKNERLGKNLKPFLLYKFRSMKVNADKEKSKLKNEVNGLFKMKDDPRITPFGKILRRSCIDELPQLINIFIGDMSLVGPRPHLQEELPNFHGWRMARFKVKPGLTGLWQVNGRHELNFDKAVLYDVYYAKHMSLLLDISIILKTIPSIIMTNGRY
jgi:exopolysaccharide biosynthesis polyprenyl glycosylphosphotransferase